MVLDQTGDVDYHSVFSFWQKEDVKFSTWRPSTAEQFCALEHLQGRNLYLGRHYSGTGLNCAPAPRESDGWLLWEILNWWSPTSTYLIAVLGDLFLSEDSDQRFSGKNTEAFPNPQTIFLCWVISEGTQNTARGNPEHIKSDLHGFKGTGQGFHMEYP